MNIYELYGRLAEQLQIESDAHKRTIELLAAVAKGEIAPDQLQVDLVAFTWSVQPKPETDVADS